MKTAVDAQRRADFLQNLAVLHLRKTAAAHFLRRGHPENADATETVDHMARNIRLAIDLLGIEMFVQKDAQLRDSAIDLGLLRCRSGEDTAWPSRPRSPRGKVPSRSQAPAGR